MFECNDKAFDFDFFIKQNTKSILKGDLAFTYYKHEYKCLRAVAHTFHIQSCRNG